MYLERFRLTGQNAVVTGGGCSIGLACADALAEAGARVIIADHDSVIAESGFSFLRAKRHGAEAVIVDVTDSRQGRRDFGFAAPRLRADRLPVFEARYAPPRAPACGDTTNMPAAKAIESEWEG